jgi:CRISPR-associated exonuclease Cas4
MLYFVAIFLLLVGLVLLWQGSRQQRATGLPSGRVIYSDTGGWEKVEKPLYDSTIGLTGKPDYIVKQGDSMIPVEVKSSLAPIQPYESHVYQLAAYCLLIQRLTGNRPTHGIIQYRNRSFAVDYTPEVESELMSLLDEIRYQERRGEAQRSHDEPARCAHCGYRANCNEKL